jgi:hypothetical protein
MKIAQIVCVVGLFILVGTAAAQTYSELWGKEGERWHPEGRLPDFSFAGYHFGEDPIPAVKAVTDVTKFGAIGDGKTDCTHAFRDAIAATEKGAILIPAGRYVISDIIWIKNPHIVLRGAGMGKTVIYCPKDLEEVRPNMGTNSGGRPTSGYSWSGGFFWVQGNLSERTVSAVTSECFRGMKTLTLEEVGSLKVGQRVSIEQRDHTDRSFLDFLYSGDPGDTKNITHRFTSKMTSRIESIAGNTITLERPLRFDIRQKWSPVIQHFNPTVSEVGIEHLSFEFPVKDYKGHFTERGMNAIGMYGVSDCWVRNVQISHCDSGIHLSGVFSTIDGLLMDSARAEKGGTTGHHGIVLGSDCLATRFLFKTHFIHDITLSSSHSGSVIKNGKGINLSFDHHRRAPYENLFCNLDVGKGSEIWRCGGGASLGKHCAARGTFWCIRSETNLKWPPGNFGPDSMILVGLQTSEPSIKEPNGKWFEAIPPEALEPRDLHAAQLQRRLEKK